MLRSVR